MKKLTAFLFIILLLAVPVTTTHAATELRVVDGADLLTPAEEAELIVELNRISTRLEFDVVVVTTIDSSGKNSMDYADDFYDCNGYGYGDDYDGALLLINMYTMEWWISTSGYGIEALTDYDIEVISEEFLPYLSTGQYYEAFSIYAQMCDEYVTTAREEERFPVVKMLGISALIGVVVGLISVSVMKAQLKSVRRQETASGYVVSGGMNLHTRSDRFLYVHRERERLPESSKGSSTHVSASGRRHGGGGGRF